MEPLMLLRLFLVCWWFVALPSVVAAQFLGGQDSFGEVVIEAEVAHTWPEGPAAVVLLDGGVRLQQGGLSLHAARAVLWIYEEPLPTSGAGMSRARVEFYGEEVVRRFGDHRPVRAPVLWETLASSRPIRLRVGLRIPDPAPADPLFLRAAQHRDRQLRDSARASLPTRDGLGPIRPVTFEEPSSPGPTEPRRLRAFPRYGRPFDVHTKQVAPDRTAVIVTGGIQLVLENIPGLGVVDIAADRMVIWTLTAEAHKATQGGTQAQDVPLELYLEGDVVIRQGPRRIEADTMYYDVRGSVALIRRAEIRMTHEPTGLPIVVRADQMRQLAAHRFAASVLQVTSSRFGRPGYRAEVREATLEEQLGPTGQLQRRLTGRDNFLYFQEIPIFYWPYFESPLEDIQSPLKRVRLRRDRTFGTQVLTTWNFWELLGWEQPPEDWDWILNLDFLSKRGPALGTELDYAGMGSPWGGAGQYRGHLEAWGIHDEGKDRLSRFRKNIEPEKNDRGRILWQHRQELDYGLSVIAEAAFLSDRNFLEQYYEQDWEEDKDQETVLYVKQQQGSWAWSVTARHRIMDFLTTTEQLPQVDFYTYGQPLFGIFTYGTHSSMGFLDHRPGDFVTGPDGIARDGGRLDTLHELSWPVSLGPVRVVPFVLGRATGWQEVRTGDDEFRLYGATGVRTSLPLWRIYPELESDLLNVHGLAHKMLFTVDYYLAQSDVPFSVLPEYDELDEDAEQVNRQRFVTREFGGLLPAELNPRLYAIRRGLLSSAETLDDLHVVRFGWRNRLQTKRGDPGARRIVDWATSDISVSWFPQEERDNFGEPIGLIEYHQAIHLGDRTSLLSDGWFEPFDFGPRFFSVGLYLDRPPRGSLLLGFSSMEPIGSEAIHFSYNYWMSPKWVSSFVTRFDFEEDKNLGQSLVLTRLGADFLVRLEIDVDPLKDDFGVSFAVYPRFDPELYTGRVREARLPLADAPVE
jgi:hypothetical protein